MERTPLVIAVALVALAGLATGLAKAYSGNEYRVLTVLWVNTTPVHPGDLGEPLTALTKVGCGDAVAAVYGYRSGEPLLIVIYGVADRPASSLRDALSCPKRLMPCLSAVGLGDIVEKLDKQLAELSSRNTSSATSAAETTMHNQCTRSGYGGAFSALLFILGLVTGFITARMLGRRHRAAS